MTEQEPRAKLDQLLADLEREPTVGRYVAVSRQVQSFDAGELGLVSVRVALVSTFTAEPLVPYLVAEGARRGLVLDVRVGPFGQVTQELMSAESGTLVFRPDCLIVLPRLADVSAVLGGDWTEAASDDQIEAEAATLAGSIAELWDQFRQRSNAMVLWTGFVGPTHRAWGLLDGVEHPPEALTVADINGELQRLAKERRDIRIVAQDELASYVGHENWFDFRRWYTVRCPLSATAVGALCRRYAAYMAARYGKAKKCLVLDLDNVLWGGIVGEDGLHGIELGEEFPGNAYVAFQREATRLRRRGVVLAINSKNNSDDVMEVFEKHPGMALRWDDFSAAQVNWDDKSVNMKRLAEDLNLGLDSFVFIDDSEFERDLIRAQLPDVMVPELPADPSIRPDFLRALDVFERLSSTPEDVVRPQLYRAEAQRRHLRRKTAVIEEYYESLGMRLIVRAVDESSLRRAAQLTQRTNQFNMTTRRRSEGDISALMASPSHRLYTLRMVDRFGDAGVVGLAILECSSEEWRIDTFLLSCRVLGRTVETAFLACIARCAAEEGARYLVGEYIATQKNAANAKFYEAHGSRLVGQSDDAQLWRFDLDAPLPEAPPWFELDLDLRQTRAEEVSSGE